MNILVTGGAGFIGSNFVHHLLNRKIAAKIVVLDALTYAGNLQNLESVLSSVRFVKGSINDEDLVRNILEEDQISHIAHFAAESHVDRSIHGPDAFVETNILGTHSLLKACRHIWKDFSDKRFLHVSTDEVFGSLGPKDPAFSEITPYAPNSPYSASKAASDHLVRSYHHTYGLPTVTSNCSNNYGAYHFPEKLIPLMILNILQGKALPVYGDGLQVRDWLHVMDHCHALEMVLIKGKLGETYNIGGNNECTNIEIVKNLCKIIGKFFAEDSTMKTRFPNCPSAKGLENELLITYVKDRPGHDRRYAIDAHKIQSELGFSPLETLQSGLDKTVRWYLDNEDWWRGVLDGSYRQWLEKNYQDR